jgi:hypothetical protein
MCSIFGAQTKPRGFLATGAMIVRRETPLALYKGLGAVLSGIVPKMAIRFASFETYKGWLADHETGKTSVGNIFLGPSFSRHHVMIMVLTLMSPPSWPCCRRHGGRLGSESYGSRQDPTAGTDAFLSRSVGNTTIS